MAEIVQYETRYPAAIITLNNPDTRNALSIPMLDAIAAASDHGTTPFPTKTASHGSVR